MDTVADMWTNALDEDEEDIEQEILRREREEDEAEEANENANAVEVDEDAVDDAALASLQNLRRTQAKRVTTNPRPKLDGIRLTGDRGISAIMEMMKQQKWKGKGHEAEDLKRLMMIYEHWGHRMFPKMRFDDIIAKVEDLGRKKTVQSYLERVRLDMPLYTGTTGDVVRDDAAFDDVDDEAVAAALSIGIDDEWDRLVNSQPPTQVRTDVSTIVSSVEEPEVTGNRENDEQFDYQPNGPALDISTAAQLPDGATQVPSTSSADVSTSVLSPDVAARIAANRERALERRRLRLLEFSGTSANSS